ncbi:MAG: redoxin domain-containing protein [Gemmatimonadetes bacterium]|nr:redoxin domain-containing protein [Gemmatimonadota bacterium]
MRKPASLYMVGVSSFILGLVAAEFFLGSRADAAATADSSWELPVAAQREWFPPVSEYETDGEPLDEEKFEALMAAVDEAMTAEETLADFEREAVVHLMNFIRRLAPSEVGDEQKERIKAYLAELAEQHPDHSSLINQRAGLVDAYAAPMGESAPSLAGSLLIFGDGDDYNPDGDLFDDGKLDRMMARMDAVMNIPATLADFEDEARLHFWRFSNRLQQGRLAPEQVDRVAAYFDGLKEEHPDAAEMIDNEIFVVRNLVPGNVAPNIVGADTDGDEFELEEYRGNIVALIFSGQWCGPCRREYPYHRFVLENYQDRSIVLLGINSDAELETIRQAKIDEQLPYRTWWDGHSQPDADVVAADGPIATRWNVTGWPTIYILDEEGVIRFVGKRGGEFIAALDELYLERMMGEYEAGPVGETEEEGAAETEAEGASGAEGTADTTNQG